MGINNIQLNPLIVADLYKDSLVELEETLPGIPKVYTKTNDEPITGQKKQLSNIPFKYLGENKKNILILVRYPDVVHIPDQQLNFITSMLGACKLSLGDVAILNINECGNDIYMKLKEQFNSKVVLLFGPTPSDIGMPMVFPEFQVQQFNNCTYLTTPSPLQLESDKVLKSKLWVCLRRIFGV